MQVPHSIRSSSLCQPMFFTLLDTPSRRPGMRESAPNPTALVTHEAIEKMLATIQGMIPLQSVSSFLRIFKSLKLHGENFFHSHFSQATLSLAIPCAHIYLTLVSPDVFCRLNKTTSRSSAPHRLLSTSKKHLRHDGQFGLDRAAALDRQRLLDCQRQSVAFG